MREITKSLLSYGWAMSVFSVQQTANLFRRGERQDNRATEAFEGVTAAVTEQFDDTVKAAFHMGDQMQRGMVDMMSGGMGMVDPTQVMGVVERVTSVVTGAVGCAGAPGCGGAREAAGDRMPPGASFGRGPSGSPVGGGPGYAPTSDARAWGRREGV